MVIIISSKDYKEYSSNFVRPLIIFGVTWSVTNNVVKYARIQISTEENTVCSLFMISNNIYNVRIQGRTCYCITHYINHSDYI